MRRSVSHYWRIHLSVVIGAAIATAVLTGALLVGDSVRGSLRDLTLDRLGRIDDALVSERFFREGLAVDMSGHPSFPVSFEACAPAILLQGSAVDPGARSRASGIHIHGVDHRFTALFPQNGTVNLDTLLTRAPYHTAPPVVINESLQRELRAEVGAPILLSFEKKSDIPREFLFGRTDASDITNALRLIVTGVVPDQGMGRFGLRPHQSLPLNAFVPISVLQQSIEQEGRVNALYAARRKEMSDQVDAQTLQGLVQQTWRLDDLGLRLRERSGYVSLESAEFLLKPYIIEAAKTVATSLQKPVLRVLTYAANTLTANGRTIPYSTVTALNIQYSIFNIQLIDGSPAPTLNHDEILLNTWAANNLSASAGDTVVVQYYIAGSQSELTVASASMRVKGIVAMKDLAVDPGLIPDYPGIRDADDISAWDAPFPIDYSLIRPEDEAYWDAYGAIPKAFVSEETGRRLWRSRFGDLTALWIIAPQPDEAQAAGATVRQALLDAIRPEQAGMVFQPVKAQGLQAASGATDFSMLFIGFSLFLILSAALLVGLLFRLGIEHRVGEVGLMRAVGYPVAAVRRRFILEGSVLAGLGGVIGLGGAVGYAYLMMVGLRTWWVDAVGTPFLSLHVTAWSLALGFGISVSVVLFAIHRTVRHMERTPIRSLLSGVTDSAHTSAGRFARWTALAGITAAILLIGVSLFTGTAVGSGYSVFFFFGSGMCMLVAGLAFFSLWLRAERRRSDRLLHSGFALTARMGARDTALNPGRSTLCVALVGCACFIIVSVGANRRVTVSAEAPLPGNAGVGGFALMAESDIPLHHDLNQDEGRFELGFADEDATILDRSQTVSLRKLPGEDVSCLNLYQPEKPTILGVSDEMISRGGFQFQALISTTPEEHENPWRLLEREMEPGVIPAFGDYNSVLWILHAGLGDDVVVQNQRGETVRLRLVGLFRGSVFQSELLIAETQFLNYFPEQSGYAYFLIQTPQETAEQVGLLLEDRLNGYGFDVTPTTERIARYRMVENTYLSTFQTLGGLGLLLGTLGLGIILIRNALERTGEMAILRAFGFSRAALSIKLVFENGFLLVSGLLTGSISALIAVAPQLTAPDGAIPWLSLASTLGLVLLAGLLASLVAVYLVIRRPLIPVLKGE